MKTRDLRVRTCVACEDMQNSWVCEVGTARVVVFVECVCWILVDVHWLSVDGMVSKW